MLAQTETPDSVVGNPRFMRLEFMHYGTVAVGVAIAMFFVFVMVVSCIWLVRTFIRLQQRPQHSLQPIDESSQQIADARAHLDASKRHIAALEEKLDQIQEQLKRRPLL
ncbi:MAG: hypothetical protein NT013_13035 [Planctomycetia bacterium]|nr:hypothetical protein [Planctomycetia bacterium]